MCSLDLLLRKNTIFPELQPVVSQNFLIFINVFFLNFLHLRRFRSNHQIITSESRKSIFRRPMRRVWLFFKKMQKFCKS